MFTTLNLELHRVMMEERLRQHHEARMAREVRRARRDRRREERRTRRLATVRPQGVAAVSPRPEASSDGAPRPLPSRPRSRR